MSRSLLRDVISRTAGLSAGLKRLLLDWEVFDLAEINAGVELALVGSFTAMLGEVWGESDRRYYGLDLCSAGFPGRYFRVGVFDVPESSDYGFAFQDAELRHIEVI